MVDKIIALVALASMIASLVVVAVFVPSIDLMVVIALVSALAAYDFWQALSSNGNDQQG
jgi:hypothetical protein